MKESSLRCVVAAAGGALHLGGGASDFGSTFEPERSVASRSLTRRNLGDGRELTAEAAFNGTVTLHPRTA
jgi:hypothetical protein